MITFKKHFYTLVTTVIVLAVSW